MLYFNKDVNKTLIDIPGKVSCLIHFNCGCNLNCYHCHNRSEIFNITDNDIIDENEMLTKLKLVSEIFDCFIFSGGELTLLSSDELLNFFIKLRSFYSKDIVIYTNGYKYDTLKTLYNSGLINDYYMDIKFPYWIDFTEEDKKLYREITGIEYNQVDINNLKKSITLLCNRNFRTVEYPILINSYKYEISTFVKNCGISHKFTPFVHLD